jgi:hypothetical protein
MEFPRFARLLTLQTWLLVISGCSPSWKCPERVNATSTCYTSIHTGCRAATDSLYKVTINHACALRTTAAPWWVLPLASNYFQRKK